MKLLSSIEEALQVTKADYVVLNTNTFAQLLDELEARDRVEVDDVDIVAALGVYPLLDEFQKKDFVLAKRC
jgi:anionic cell wall polymer biosynthesis LytR-Cps2A-Psr (LCP) family protein